ncbi:SPOR domain-containing protein [Legionella sp. CNM-4043-24]|uniref:SPOR domain-containing protein n=1 Tax=Legionella sp. CNM-4043-24 TaxID=3421646 RepID=UPI00403B0612
MNTFSRLSLVACAAALSSCAMTNETSYTDYQSMPYVYDQTQYYSQSYGSMSGYSMSTGGSYDEYRPKPAVNVPDSYHVGAYGSPQRAKDSDRNWVVNQNPQAYTIEVADDQKPSVVAGKLYKIPKTDRMGEVKYQRNGTPYYKGLYGSYSSQEEAQKALDALPPDIKQGAGIKNWGSVQSNISE